MTMEIPRARVGTQRTQLHVPSVEDRYVLLEIHYMIIVLLQGAALGRVVSILSMLRYQYV
jgi:hypothetical protein